MPIIIRRPDPQSPEELVNTMNRIFEDKRLHTRIGTKSALDFLGILVADRQDNVTKADIRKAFITLAEEETPSVAKADEKVDGSVRLGNITLETFLGLVEFDDADRTNKDEVCEAFSKAAKMDMERKTEDGDKEEDMDSLAAQPAASTVGNRENLMSDVGGLDTIPVLGETFSQTANDEAPKFDFEDGATEPIGQADSTQPVHKDTLAGTTVEGAPKNNTGFGGGSNPNWSSEIAEKQSFPMSSEFGLHVSGENDLSMEGLSLDETPANARAPNATALDLNLGPSFAMKVKEDMNVIAKEDDRKNRDQEGLRRDHTSMTRGSEG